MKTKELRAAYEAACVRVHEAADAIDKAEKGADLEPLNRAHAEVLAEADQLKVDLDAAEARDRGRTAHPKPEPAASDDADKPDDADKRTPAGDDAAKRGDVPQSKRIEIAVEDHVYREEGQFSFFGDLIRVRSGDEAARKRMIRNNLQVLGMAEDGRRVARSRYTDAQVRAISQTAGAGGEFVYPLWLQQYEPLLRAGRAFADRCTGLPLPDGTNLINVPKVTTSGTVAVQTDGGGVSNTDQVTTSVAAAVQSLAGRTVASYQLVDLSSWNIDRFIFEDLLMSYWPALDTALINGNVTNAKGILNVTGINAVTYTDASPTLPEAYAPFMQAKSQVEKGIFLPVDFWLTHPSEWNFFLSGLDTANRPLSEEVSAAKFNAIAEFSADGAQGLAGTLAGIPVITDANVPVNLGGTTTESRFCALSRRTLVTYEGIPRFKAADQTNIANLQWQFVMWGYYAAAFPRQPKAISVISGTGMIVQAGF